MNGPEPLFCANVDGRLVCVLAESAAAAAEMVGLDGVAFRLADSRVELEWDARTEGTLNEHDVEMLLSLVRRGQRDQAGRFRRYRERGLPIPPAAVNRAIHLAELRGKLEVLEPAPGADT